MDTSPSYHEKAARVVEEEDHSPFRWVRYCIEKEAYRRRAIWVLSLLALLSILAVAAFSTEVAPLPLDPPVYQTIEALPASPLDSVMRAISWPGFNPWNAIIVVGTAILVMIWLGWPTALYLMLVTALQGLVNIVIKLFIPITRPNPLEDNNPIDIVAQSFPSGHVMLYIVFFGFLFYLVWTRLPRSLYRNLLLALLGFLVVTVGPARLYLGTHWLSDIIVAEMLGFALLLLSIDIYERYVVPWYRKREEEAA